MISASSSSVVGIVGLAIGEGLGEVENCLRQALKQWIYRSLFGYRSIPSTVDGAYRNHQGSPLTMNEGRQAPFLRRSPGWMYLENSRKTALFLKARTRFSNQTEYFSRTERFHPGELPGNYLLPRAIV